MVCILGVQILPYAFSVDMQYAQNHQKHYPFDFTGCFVWDVKDTKISIPQFGKHIIRQIHLIATLPSVLRGSPRRLMDTPIQ